MFWHRCCFVVFFSLFLFLFFFSFLRNLSSSSSLVLLFFLKNPFVQDLKLSDLLPIFVFLRVLSSLLDLIVTSYQYIGQNSPKKLKQKETVRTSKNRSQFTEPGGQTAVRAGPSFFLHGTTLHPKQTVKLNSSRFFRLDHMFRSGFQNLFESKRAFCQVKEDLRNQDRLRSLES